MITFICLFFPPVLGVWMYESLTGQNLTRKKWAYRFVLNTLTVNLICFAIKFFLLRTADAPLWNLQTDMTPSVALRYLVMALPVCAVFSLIQSFLSRHFSVTLEENSHD